MATEITYAVGRDFFRVNVKEDVEYVVRRAAFEGFTNLHKLNGKSLALRATAIVAVEEH